MNIAPALLKILAAACGLLLSPGLARAADGPTAQKAAVSAAATPITSSETAAAKTIFAGQCSWCHGNYGMTAEKGPKLAGTKMTKQEVEERIRNGKPGYMPSFKRFLDDQQIALMAKYIKSLKP